MAGSGDRSGVRTLRGKCLCGADRLLIFGKESPHDAHCGQCGSLLYSLVREAKFVHVTLGTLVDTPSIRPSACTYLVAGTGAEAFGMRVCLKPIALNSASSS
jgi:hypothetical protein